MMDGDEALEGLDVFNPFQAALLRHMQRQRQREAAEAAEAQVATGPNKRRRPAKKPPADGEEEDTGAE